VISQKFKIIFCCLCISFAGAASSEDSKTDEGSEVADSDATQPALDRCFTVPGYTDMNVMSDQHLYVRTRGNNHYLVTTEHCNNLQSSYHRGTARLIPYGRTVCQNDGSYLLYDAGGRESTCPILTVERVRNRAEAKSIAANDQAEVEVEAVIPAE
jgi:hypothetical protein